MKTQPQLRAPFPYFGGKGPIAAEVWARLGPVRHYIEPFAGSLAALLARPGWKPEVLWTETVNDADGLLVNFWRALAADPEAVAAAADWPVIELDLYARNKALIEARQGLTDRLRADPRWYDAELAGWWVWGMGATIGDGWGAKLYRQLPKLSGHGSGIHRVSGGGGLEARREVLERYHRALVSKVA